MIVQRCLAAGESVQSVIVPALEEEMKTVQETISQRQVAVQGAYHMAQSFAVLGV